MGTSNTSWTREQYLRYARTPQKTPAEQAEMELLERTLVAETHEMVNQILQRLNEPREKSLFEQVFGK